MWKNVVFPNNEPWTTKGLLGPADQQKKGLQSGERGGAGERPEVQHKASIEAYGQHALSISTLVQRLLPLTAGAEGVVLCVVIPRRVFFQL